MASAFDRWEKDPFFSAAEEVQESADRMESTYRTWIHAANDTSGVWNLDELRRGLQTTLGTTKWQLEEFGRAVALSYPYSNSFKDAKPRHQSFISAIESQVAIVESSLNKSSPSSGKPPSPWTRLDEGERNELAMFLSGPSLPPSGKASGKVHDMNSVEECSRSSSHLVQLDQMEEGVQEKLPGHRRTASASPEIGSWKIMVSHAPPMNGVSSTKPPRRAPSFAGLLNSMEFSVSKFKWPSNGYKKLEVSDLHQDADTALPTSQNSTRGLNGCYDKNKSCIDCCDDYYEKHLHGWYGAVQRLLQRSQYQIQYSKPVQVVFCTVLLCLLVLLAILII